MKTLQLPWLQQGIKFFLVCLFIYAAITKSFQFHIFVIQLKGSPLVPLELVRFTAIATIAIEFLIVLLLMIDRCLIWGLWLSYSLMLFFTVYIAYLLNFPEFIPCACGGILGDMSHQTHLIFNLIVTLLTLAAIFLYYNITPTNSANNYATKKADLKTNLFN